MRSFLVRKINNFTKTQSLRAKVPNTYGARLYSIINGTLKWYLRASLNVSAKVTKSSIYNTILTLLIGSQYEK